MSLIEGLGDEVTFTFILLTLILVAVIAWVSTHTRDIPFISVICVELSRRTEQNQRAGTTNNIAVVQDDVQDVAAVQDDVVVGDVQSASKRVTNDNASCDEVTESTNEYASSDHVVNSANQVRDGVTNENGVENAHDGNVAMVTEESRTIAGEQFTHGDSDGLNSVHLKGDNAHCVQTTPSEHRTADHAVSSENNTDGITASEHNPTDKMSEHSTTDHAMSENNTDDTISEHNPIDTVEVSELRNRRLAFFNTCKQGDSSADRPGSDSSESQPISTDPSVVSQSELHSHHHHHADTHHHMDTEHRTDTQGSSGDSEHHANTPHQADTDTQQSSEDSAQSRAEAQENEIRVRLKYLNDMQRLVYTRPSQTVEQFRRKHFASELANNKLVRFIFNGQDLRNDGFTLQSYNIVDNSVVHCLVTQTQQPPLVLPVEDDLELGHMMLPLFGLILSVIWYLRFSYRQYFNAMSTLCLVGVTFLFFLGVISSWHGHRRRAHLD